MKKIYVLIFTALAISIELYPSAAQSSQGSIEDLLYSAILSDKIEDVREILKSNQVDINQRLKADGATPLFIAAHQGHTEVAEELLKLGQLTNPKIDINKAMTTDGATPLFIAAQNGYVKVVKLLLDNGANINQGLTADGETPLYVAAFKGHVGVVSLLLEGVQINKQSKDTVAGGGAVTSNQSMILQRVKADPNIARKDGFTPLYTAAERNHVDVVEKLLTLGQHTDPKININQAVDGFTPLYTAVENGHINVVEKLLTLGQHTVPKIDINKAITTGATPLYIAALNGHVNIVEKLLMLGQHTDPKININQAKTTGATPLYIAAQEGHMNVVEKLLMLGQHTDPKININQAAQSGTTPLYVAALNGHAKMVEKLLMLGQHIDPKININQATHSRVTPLYAAAFKGHTEVVRLLLEGVQINKQSKDTVAGGGAVTSNQSMILQRVKADPNIASNDGFTPLYVAALNGHVDIVNLLVNNNDIEPIQPNEGNNAYKVVLNKLHSLDELYSFGSDLSEEGKKERDKYLKIQEKLTKLISKLAGD